MAVIQRTVWLPEELWRAIELLSEQGGDVNTVVIRALEEYLVRTQRQGVHERPGKYQARIRHLSRPVADLNLSW